jgi:Uncharacterised protein family, YAP/Alf4/glomulin
MLLPYIGRKSTVENANKVLNVVTAKGNAKEVFLKCIEALKMIIWENTVEEDDNDDEEATLAGKIVEVSVHENGDKQDSMFQTIQVYHAINTGYFLLYCVLREVFKRIRTDHPARFLTTFAAALLSNITLAFETRVDMEQPHSLLLNFITSSLEIADHSKDNEILSLLHGVITTYIPVFLGNHMVFWSGRYWEANHPVISQRVKSKDRVNVKLEDGLALLLVQLDLNFLLIVGLCRSCGFWACRDPSISSKSTS